MRKSLVFILLLHFNALSAQSRLDSLLAIPPQASGKEWVHTLNEISYEYKFSNLDSSLFYGRKSVAEAQKTKDQQTVAAAYNALASAFEARSEYDSALHYHSASMAIKEEIGDSLGIANSYNNLGIIYDLKGDYSAALNHYFEALKLYQNHADSYEKVPMVYVNIGVVYKQLEAYEKVLGYYQKAIAIYKENGDKVGEVITTGNSSSIYLKMQEYPQAIATAERAAQLYDSLGYPRYVPYMMANVAIGYDSLHQYEKARAIYQTIIPAFKAEGNAVELSGAWIGSGHNYFLTNEYEKAETDLIKGLAIAQQEGLLEQETLAHLLLAKTYAKSGRTKQAYVALEHYVSLRDSLFGKEKTKALLELEQKYQSERKSKELAESKHELILTKKSAADKELELSNRNLLLSIAIGIIAILILGILVVRQTLIRKKEREKNLAVLKEKQRGLHAIIDSQEAERSRIAKDLHDSVGQQLASIKYIISQLANQQQLDAEAAKNRFLNLEQLVEQSATETRLISHQMMPASLEVFGVAAALQGLVNDSYRDTGITAKFEALNIKEKLPARVELTLFRVAQEMINNNLKHSRANKVSLQLYKKNNSVFLVMEDDGKGIPQEMVDADGGFTSMRSRLEVLAGQLTIQNLAKGCMIVARVPLAAVKVE